MRPPESDSGVREENRLTEIDWIIQMPGRPEIFQALMRAGWTVWTSRKMNEMDVMDCRMMDEMDLMDVMDAAGKKAWRGALVPLLRQGPLGPFRPFQQASGRSNKGHPKFILARREPIFKGDV